jgi:dihydroorotate dehydrogenase
MPINLSWVDFKKLLDVIVKYELDGVIIGNLTKKRDTELIKDELPKNIKGGISGKPTEKLNNNLISKTYKQYQDKLIIIGVGGIFNAEDAYDKIKRGATLVQLITGMVFEGPQLIGEINQKLVILLKKDGYRNIREAVGAYY